MADRSQLSSITIKKEAVSGTWATPGVGDEIIAADLRITPQPLTQDLNEYTGTIHRPGEALVGETVEVSAKFYLRGPGGTAVPAADAFVLGRVMQSIGFTEVRNTTAIPVAPEAAAAGTTTSVTLGAGAAATAEIYKGLLIDLVASHGGVRPKRFSQIRAYSAAKLAELAETLAVTYAGNYQIPQQLTYLLTPAVDLPTLSIGGNAGGKKYSCAGMAPTSWRLNLPTASRDNQEPPFVEVTFSGKIYSVTDEAPLVVTPTIAPPGFRNGKMFINKVALGGSSLSIDFNAETSYPPNPNEPDGYETGLLTRTTRRVSMTLNQVSDAVINLRTLAQTQGYHPILAMYGVGSGNFFGVMVTDARFFTPTPDISGPLVTAGLEAVIDGSDKVIAIGIPFYT